MAEAAAEPMNCVEGGPAGLPAQTPELDLKYYSSLEYFEVEKKIGHGQFSVVYRARNTVDGKVVALKKIQVCTSFLVVATSLFACLSLRFLTWWMLRLDKTASRK